VASIGDLVCVASHREGSAGRPSMQAATRKHGVPTHVSRARPLSLFHPFRRIATTEI